MNFYEHTIIARQDISPSQIKQLQEKYTKIIENNDGDILKFESWGLMHLSYLIKKKKVTICISRSNVMVPQLKS